jgi:3D (Asp-Asp-Asp) domain-containing protein
MDRRVLYIEKIYYLNAVFLLWLRKIRVQLVLAVWLIPDWIIRKAARLRSELPVARAVTAAVLVLAIALPSTLYLKERRERIRYNDAYRYLNVSTSSEISTLKHTLGALMDEQSVLRSMLLDTGRPVISDGELAIRLVASGYSSSVLETDETPFITASNTRTRTGIVALSRDLLKRYNARAPFSFGDTIHITGLGDFVVEDSMNWRWRRRMDIWFPSRAAARRFGVRKVVVTKPLRNDASEGDETALDLSGGTGVTANTALAR